jgi:hypothetical protein
VAGGTFVTATFVLVGHCGADSFLLSRAVTRAVAGAKVVSANAVSQLEPLIAQGNVLLVNRVLDGMFDRGGVELIRTTAQRANAPVMLLISNHTDAQASAEGAGAMPGFGKAELEEPETARRLQQAAAAALEAARTVSATQKSAAR